MATIIGTESDDIIKPGNVSAGVTGEAYRDGGYMGNPALFPLVDECDARDMLPVQINPIERDQLPTTAADIANRVNEITFNASLIKELRLLGFLWEVIHHEGL